MIGRPIISWLNKRSRRILERVRIYKHRKVLQQYKKKTPQRFKPVDALLEKKHKALWSPFYASINLDFLRWYCNCSNIHDYRYLPDDIYKAVIQRILNDSETANYDSDKNRLDLIVGKEHCPKFFLKNVNGTFLSANNEVITNETAKTIFTSLKENLFVKPSKLSGRGINISLYKFKNGKFYRDQEEVNFEKLNARYKSNYIIQEQFKQHIETAQFHPESLNTFRVNTYRSPKDEQIHVLSTFFKAGIDKNIVDNTNAGGLWMFVHPDGRIKESAFSLNKDYSSHPNSGTEIINFQFHHMHRITDKAKYAAEKFTNHRLVAHDIALDQKGNAIIVEVNLIGIGVRQWLGGPYFGDFTHEVVEFCIKNRYSDQFQTIRV